MEYQELAERVQETADLVAPQEAMTALEAVLGTLGELLSPTERRHLATQLRKPLKDGVDRWIERPPRERTGPHRFRLEEFYNRVAARSGLRYPRAVICSQALMGVLREAISPGELADTFRESLPEYNELLTGTTRGTQLPRPWWNSPSRLPF
jgi:uncharacterized protein (DUF2267 family)